MVRTILTVNFDRLIYDACRSEPKPRRVEWIQTPNDAELISTSPIAPQVIHLHGSVEHYNDQNLEDETQTLDPKLRERIVPLLRDHPLIVVGYRGAEPSIMCDLLMQGAATILGFRNGVYWCSLSEPSDIHPLVAKLADQIGSNFQLVRIEGFDQAMSEWTRFAQDLHPGQTAPPPPAPRTAPDLQPSTGRLDGFDWALVSRTLRDYSERLALDLPLSPSRDVLTRQLVSLELAVEEDGEVVPTRGGELLFSSSPVCCVEIRLDDDPVEEPIAGNVLSVLERTLDVLGDVNEPFTLKGGDSQHVRLYPPLALKEFVVNALVHRDYSATDAVQIDVRDGRIEIRSPGGLYHIDASQLGKPGQKAYRNPVIADFCYGTGLMDKRGSGLFDVLRWSRENGGDASFEPDNENESFTAVLLARPERPDPATGAATPERNLESFASNILPLRLVGDDVHLAPTRFTSRVRLFDSFPGVSFPPFAITEDAIVTFSKPTGSGEPFARGDRARRRCDGRGSARRRSAPIVALLHVTLTLRRSRSPSRRVGEVANVRSESVH